LCSGFTQISIYSSLQDIRY